MIDKVVKELKIVPRLRFGNKRAKGGVDSTGPHRVKFLEEPTIVMRANDKGKQVQNLRFILEEKGTRYCWFVPLLNKENQPSYLIERLIDINVGSERIIELMSFGGKNYYDVIVVDDTTEVPVTQENF